MIKVIIADDETHICRLIQALIEWDELDMELSGVANNGIEAMELIRDKRPDILITDIRMPGCTGLELIKQAKEILPELQIMIISGYAHFEYAQQAMKYGVGDYILKPIKQEELNSTLRRMSEKWKSSQSIEDRLQMAKQSDQDLSRLRRSLIENMLDKESLVINGAMMTGVYHMNDGNGVVYQPYEMKIDQNLKVINANTVRVIYEKTERILDSMIGTICRDHVTACRNMAVYGVMLYKTENEEDIRGMLRNAMHKAEEEASPLGTFEFTIALGREVTKTEMLTESFRELPVIAQTRITEGSGRIYTETERPSAINRPMLIDHFTSEIEKRSDTISAEEAVNAAAELEESSSLVPDVRGREIYQTVIDAGRAFISRMEKKDQVQAIASFEEKCNGCSCTHTIFQALKNMMKDMTARRDEELENATVRPVREAKKYVCDHFSENVTLEEISDSLGFSSSYFSVLFKKETGEGFAKYLTQVRMDEAKRLLRETDIPVAQIAENVGYQDQKHFTQIFRKAAGINPGEYRKLYG